MRSLLDLSPGNEMFRKDTQFFIDADAELASVKEVVGCLLPGNKRRCSEFSGMREASPGTQLELRPEVLVGVLLRQAKHASCLQAACGGLRANGVDNWQV